MGSTYIVLKEYPVQTIINLIDDTNKIEIDGMIIPVDKEKMLAFKNSTKCLTCDIEATHFSLEKIANCTHGLYGNYHFNLYGSRNNNKILLTVDHAILAKNNGEHHHTNFNTMCVSCNNRRGSKFENIDDFITFSKLNPISKHISDTIAYKKKKELFEKTVQKSHVQLYYKNRNKKLA